jgi:hypothetical protein
VTRQTIYGFIAAEKITYPVRLLRRVLHVSASVFYDWLHCGRPHVSEEDLTDAHDANLLREAWVAHRRTCGVRRLKS